MKIRSDSSFTYHALHDKEKRNLAILELIRKKGAVSRTDISKASGINVVSVSNYINNFISNGLVLEKGFAASSGGRKPELVELNYRENYVIGLDICAETIAVMVADIGMNTVQKKRVSMPSVKREVAPAVCALVDEVLKASGIAGQKIRAAGVSVCDESLLYMRDVLKERLGVRVFMGDAPSCGAYAEKRFNPNADVERLLYIHSDLGKGVIIDGDICIGCTGAPNHAELTVPETGDGTGASSSSDKSRYLEPWSNYLGTAESAAREVSRGVGTKIVSLLSGKGVGAVTEDLVIEAARMHDDTASNIVESVAITLGLRIAYLINLYGPQTVVLGGGLEKASDISLPYIVKMVQKLSFLEHAKIAKIVPGALSDDALCSGAAALAAREVFLGA